MSASSWTSRGFDRLARSAGRWLRPRARLIEAVEMLRRDNEDIVKHVTATEGAIRELGIRVVLSAKPPSEVYAPAGPSRVLDQLKAPRTANSATRVVLFTPPGHESRIGSFFNGSFACDDVQATYRQLKARGVEFTSPPAKQPRGEYATFKDPDGNQFVLSSSQRAKRFSLRRS